MTIIRHPENSAIWVGTAEEFSLAITGDFSAAGFWIASVNGEEQELLCVTPEQAMKEGERVFKLLAERKEVQPRSLSPRRARPMRPVEFERMVRHAALHNDTDNDELDQKSRQTPSFR